MPPPTSKHEEPSSQEQPYFAPTSPWTDALHTAWTPPHDEAETAGEGRETPDQKAENALSDTYNG
jgi:hypothetical protein